MAVITFTKLMEEVMGQQISRKKISNRYFEIKDEIMEEDDSTVEYNKKLDDILIDYLYKLSKHWDKHEEPKDK